MVKWAIGSQKKTRSTTTVPSCLHVGSCHAAELLLKDGEHVPHSGGESLGVQHTDGAATLGNGQRTKNVQSRRARMQSWQQRVKNIKKHIVHAPMRWQDNLPCRSPTPCRAELSPEGCASPSSRWCSWWCPGSRRTGRPPGGDVQFLTFRLYSVVICGISLRFGGNCVKLPWIKRVGRLIAQLVKKSSKDDQNKLVRGLEKTQDHLVI